MGREANFKVGDHVQIREWFDMENEFGVNDNGDIPCLHAFVSDMRECCGAKAIIVDMSMRNDIGASGASFILKGKIRLSEWTWSADMIRHVH